MTATDDPGRTWAVNIAAPAPVAMPQPMSASCSAGRSDSTLTASRWSIVMWSANAPSPSIAVTSSPPARCPRTGRRTLMVSPQRWVWPFTHQ
jgi:hypothetical protein